MSSTSPAISVQGLKKSYGEVEAVKGIDFEIQPGEVFGLLGPNGAGKTTTVEILEGLRPRTGGQVAVLGFDPDKQRQRLKDRIGVCLQATNLPEKIRVHEAMDVFASFYSRNVESRPTTEAFAARRKAERLLRHAFGRSEAAARSGPSPGERSAAHLPRRTYDRA